MSASNMSCSSCMCCGEEEPTQCCNSDKCAINVRKPQQTQTCCKKEEPEEFDLNCPICREAMIKSLAKASGLCILCQEQSQKQDSKCSKCNKQEDDNKCPKCSKKEDDNKCPKCSKKEDDNKCPKCSKKEDDNKCPKCSKTEDDNKCPKCSKKEDDNKCPKCSKQEDDNKCPKCSKTEDDNKCPKCSKKEDDNKCPKCSKQEDDNKCPNCKKQDASSTKILEKQLRCPSCSQPVAIQCCSPGNPSINLVIIPEKLLKDSATNKSNDNMPCCPVPKKSKSAEKVQCPVCSSQEEKEPCCKIEEPCFKTADSRASATKQGKDKAGCGMESCISMKTDKPAIKKPSTAGPKKPPEDPKGKDLKAKKEKSATNTAAAENPKGKDSKAIKEKSATDTAATENEDENKCYCVFPPAYKQYNCTGQINGVCDCMKQEQDETAESKEGDKQRCCK